MKGASSKGESAYSELRRRIVSGELDPGSRLSQYELAEEMGMSITPLREAVRRLASEEWVEVVTHRDVRVAPVNADEARELLDVRLSLEPLATELAVLRRTDGEIAGMRAAADRLLPVTRVWGEEAVTAHREFHRAIYAASHNKVLIRFLDDVWDKSDRYRRIGSRLPAGDGPRTLDLRQHHEILELVVSGESARAGALVRSHIRNSLGAVVPGSLEQAG
nr:GntR family transcriptional regulator [Nocardiopsis ganjiahuensis]